MNNLILTGRITRDPEVRTTQAGIPSVSFSLAVDRPFKDANGQRQVDFINCVAWRNQADFISRYIRKGFMLCVQGRLQTRQYQGQDNQTHYVTEVICETVENMTPRQDNQPQGDYQPQPNYQQQPQQQHPQGQRQVAPNPTYGQPQTQPQNRGGYQQPQGQYQQPNYGGYQQPQGAVSVDDEDLPF